MNREQYRLIVESSPNMIWRANLTSECDFFNKTWLDFTGRTFEQELGFGWAEGVHPEDLDRCVNIYKEHFGKRQPFEMDYRLKRFDGEYRWINDRGTPIYNRSGQFMGFIGSCMDITEKVEGQLMKKMAQTDFLCSTYTRQHSMKLLSDLFVQARNNGHPLSVLMVDIDSFKQINDRYGHAAGDSVLKKVAFDMQSQLRETDVLGRYGGDEFIIGLPDTSRESAQGVANRILAEAAKNEYIFGSFPPFHLTLSVGVKCLDIETNLDALIDAADVKLYEAKNQGKNVVKG